tara:strand:- start:215 stop:583 length:369 start_codon:yes stop_codon:yes gene_type:complete
MAQRLYTEDHEWVEINDDVATIGISSYAVDELGEIVFVELPDVGATVSVGEEFSSVESVKTVSGIYSPVDGEVVEKNQSVVDSPETINQSPYESGWLVKVKTNSDQSELMTEDAYQSFLQTI